MKKIVPLALLITFATLLGACSKPKPVKKRTSDITSEPTTTNTTAPTSEIISSNPTSVTSIPYISNSTGVGSGDVAINHLKSLSIAPSKDFYAVVGEERIIEPVYSPSQSIPDVEKVVRWSSSNTNICDIVVDPETYKATIKCLSTGNATITARAYNDIIARSLVVHVVQSGKKVAIYQVGIKDLEMEKGRFGWENEKYEKGDTDGIISVDGVSWQYHRDYPGNIATYGGALKFGASDTSNSHKNEGAMSLKTYFARPVEKVVMELSSAAGLDYSSPATSQWSQYPFNKLPYGSVDVHAQLNGVEVPKYSDGVNYAPEDVCHSARYSREDTTVPVEMMLNGGQGDFEINLNESFGSLYLKSLIVFYTTELDNEFNDVRDNNIDFDTLSISEKLSSSYKTASARSGDITIDFEAIKQKDLTTANHYAIKSKTGVEFRPSKGYSVREVELVVANWVTNPKTETTETSETEGGETTEKEEKVQKISISLSESYSDGKMYTDIPLSDNVTYFVDEEARQATIKYSEFSHGTNCIKLLNKSSNGLGLVSAKIKVDNYYEQATFDQLEIFGEPFRKSYAFESAEYFDPFEQKGILIKASFKEKQFNPISMNDVVVWNDISFGNTSITGTTPFGSVIVDGIEVTRYVPETWVKANAMLQGRYLITCEEAGQVFPAAESGDKIRAGVDLSYVESSDGVITGNYHLDHSYIDLIFKEENINHEDAMSVSRFALRTASEWFFNGMNIKDEVEKCTMSFSQSSKDYVTFSFDSDGNLILNLTKKEYYGKYEYHIVDDSFIFGYMDGKFAFFSKDHKDIANLKKVQLYQLSA